MGTTIATTSGALASNASALDARPPRRITAHQGGAAGGPRGHGDVPRGHGDGYRSKIAWVAPRQMTFEHWIVFGRRLGAMGRGVAWWIGDWLRYGNETYDERYARASRITGYDPQTLMNMVYVASRFEISRRREKLSWSHHAELAAMPPREQDHWLDRAETDRLSVQCLRQELRLARKMTGNGGRSTSNRVELTCPHCGHQFKLERRRGRPPAQVATHG